MPSSKVYFTIVPTPTGFTDQLIQFQMIYKLGMSLGYTYVHTSFRSQRSTEVKSTLCRSVFCRLFGLLWLSPRHDVYRMLGFNRYLRSLHPAPRARKIKTVEIKLSDRVLERSHVDSFVDLQNYIRGRVTGATKQTEILKVRFETGFGWHFFSWIHANIAQRQYRLDLRSVYFQERKAQGTIPMFVEGKVRLLVHVRQGDVAVVETPWGTVIPVDRRRCEGGRLREHREATKLPGVLRPTDYHRFVKRLLSYFDAEVFSVLCFSDGYQRAFNMLELQKRSLKLSPEQRRALRCSRKSYDAEHFQELHQLTSGRCYVGETHRDLRRLIHSALTAQVVVAGGQQPTLPKFITSYDTGNLPIMIILYRDVKPDYSYIRPDHAERFIYTNADCPDYERLVDRLIRSVAGLSSLLKIAHP